MYFFKNIRKFRKKWSFCINFKSTKGVFQLTREKNIKIQLHNRVNALLAIGESKHYAKKDYKEYCEQNKIAWNPSKSHFIHSTSTADAYRQTINEFSGWLKSFHSDIWSSKDLNNISKEVAYEYLQNRESAWTISKDMSALNKVLNLNLNKSEGRLKERSYQEVSRSRGVKSHDTKYNPANYSKQIEFASAFGCRRESILGGDYQVKEISLFKNQGKVYVSLIEKGGRYREAPCLEKYQAQVEDKYMISERDFLSKNEFAKIYNSNNDNYLFDKYTSKIDNHSFRHEYSKELYKELALKTDSLKTDYHNKFDTRIVQQVSLALGHNRITDTINYLR